MRDGGKQQKVGGWRGKEACRQAREEGMRQMDGGGRKDAERRGEEEEGNSKKQ